MCALLPSPKKFSEPLHTLPPQNWLKPHEAGFSNSHLKHKSDENKNKMKNEKFRSNS